MKAGDSGDETLHLSLELLTSADIDAQMQLLDQYTSTTF